MNTQEILRTYAMFYVSENDDFSAKEKLDLLNIVESAEETELMGLFESGKLEAPTDLLFEDDRSDAALIGEASIMCEATQHLLEGDHLLELDLQNRLKDLLGMETDLKYKIAKAAGSAKKALMKQLDNVQDKIGDLRDAIAKGAGKAVEKAKDVAGAAKDVAGDVGEKVSKGVSKGVETAKDVAGDVGEKVSGAASKAAEYAQQHPGMVGGAVAAAAALTAGVMAYRKFFSKAAQACKSAPDKAACMAQYKMKAKQAQIATLNAGKAKCAKSKAPDKCKAKIDAKISALKAKMSK
jgi:hypothetical protein